MKHKPLPIAAVEAYASGDGTIAIGRRFGITRQRAQQVIKRASI